MATHPIKIPMEIRVFSDPDALADAITERIRGEIAAAASCSSPQGIMLSGGSTPLAVFKRLEEAPPKAPSNLHLFMSDDRYVDMNSDEFNYQNATPMFNAMGLEPGQALKVQTDIEPKEACATEYGQQLESFVAKGGELPFGILGMGGDGHTASLFSAEHIEAAKGKWAIAVDRPDGRQGISLTPHVFDQIGSIVFLIAGAGKKPALKQLLEGSSEIAAPLAVANCQNVEIWIDEAAQPDV